MQVQVKTFEQLTTAELYNLLQLRSEVFVVEQDCVYQDIDGKDTNAWHVLGIKNNEIVAYTRIFKSGDYFALASIGRVVVKASERTFGYGHNLMAASIQFIRETLQENDIKISAQEYLIKFYESHGFQQIGEGYLEDGIPHIAMINKK